MREKASKWHASLLVEGDRAGFRAPPSRREVFCAEHGLEQQKVSAGWLSAPSSSFPRRCSLQDVLLCHGEEEQVTQNKKRAKVPK